MKFNKTQIKEIKNNKPFFIKNFYPNLISWKELENLLNLRPFVNAQRFHTIPSEKIQWNDTAWLSDLNCYPPNLLNEIINKKVCYISDSSRVNKKINNFCDYLENITKFPGDAHLYFSLNKKETNKKGFGIHKDTQDNVIIASEGSFIIQVFSKEKPDKKEKPLIEEEMKNGDAVYIPNQFYHCIKTLTKRLSVSFCVAPYANIKYKQNRNWIYLL
jgi:hypothetical protein